MKKLLAILLTLILTFSCFSILGTGVALAEENKNQKTELVMESDFDDSDGTNWQGSNKNVQFLTEDGVSYARVNSTTTKGDGLVSSVFNLVPGNKYELTFDFRIPKELSNSYIINGSTFYAPNFLIYEPKVGSSGVKVSNKPKITNTSTENNLYAYNQKANADKGIEAWSRRPSFKAEWQVGNYGTVTKEKFSYLSYSDHKNFIGATTDARDAYSDWTSVTVKFTAVADEAGETSQTAALGFTFYELKSTGYIFDVKDVKLLETADAVVKEPEITEDVVYYQGFENLTDPTSAVTVYNGVSANPNWVEPTISAGDATTGKNSYSVYAMYQNIFIPLDKSKLVNDTVYSVSLDWKLLEYTNEKKRHIYNIYLVGYTPEEGVAFKDNHKALTGVATLNGTGKWENAKFNFKVADYSKYEQYGIYILYKTSGTNTNPDDRLYLDTILVKKSADQTVVDPLEIKEEPRKEDTIKVLAFGNSFSNDGTSFIPQIAAADGKDIRVGDCSIGGCPISKHYNNSITNSPSYSFNYRQASGSKSYGSSITMRQALEATDWDYITIQQVSTQSGDYSTFNYQLEHLINYFKEVCPNAKILLHSTWAYKDGIEKEGYEKYGNDQETMYNAIKETYLKASEDYGFIQIIPTGEAIQRLRGQMSDTLFTTETEGSFTRDGYHLSEKGRVAAALVWYEIFTGVSAVDCNIDLTQAISTLTANNSAIIGITKEEETTIKNAAHEAAALYKKANEAQLAIEAIGTVDKNSGKAIAKATALRAELNDDTFLPNLQTLLDTIEAFKAFEGEQPDPEEPKPEDPKPDDTATKGDVDGVEGITDADAEYLLMYTFFPEDYPINGDCDINGDGSVDDADAEYLLMYTFFPEDYPIK